VHMHIALFCCGGGGGAFWCVCGGGGAWWCVLALTTHARMPANAINP
jgi:hypothetical protein